MLHDRVRRLEKVTANVALEKILTVDNRRNNFSAVHFCHHFFRVDFLLAFEHDRLILVIMAIVASVARLSLHQHVTNVTFEAFHFGIRRHSLLVLFLVSLDCLNGVRSIFAVFTLVTAFAQFVVLPF